MLTFISFESTLQEISLKKSNIILILFFSISEKKSIYLIIKSYNSYIVRLLRERRMKISIFNKDDFVLLVGEGNFSFSVALLRHNLNIKLIATCYESSVSQETAKENIKYLQNNG